MRNIEISEEVYGLVLAIAKKKAKSVEEVILECIVKDVDPGMRIEVYMKLHEKYLRVAEELYAKGDLAQAGEKYWEAVTALLNTIGERKRVGATIPIKTMLKSRRGYLKSWRNL